MGIEGGKDLLHEINSLDGTGLKLAVNECLGIGRKGKIPVVAVDCNWVGYYLNIGRKTSTAAKSTANLILILKRMGYRVIPVTDGKHRCHTKRASIERSAKIYVKKVDAVMARNKIICLNQTLQMKHTDNGNIDNMTSDKEREKCVKTLKGLGNSLYTLPESFTSELKEELHNMNAFDINENGGFVVKVMEAKFQADSVLALLVAKNEVDLIFCNDSDIHLLSGCDCLQVSEFKITAGRGKTRNYIELMHLKGIIIKCSHKSSINKILDKLRAGGDNMTENTKYAKFPILETLGEYASPYFRALIAVTLGCDVLKGGVHSIGPSKLYKFISNEIASIRHLSTPVHCRIEDLIKKISNG